MKKRVMKRKKVVKPKKTSKKKGINKEEIKKNKIFTKKIKLFKSKKIQRVSSGIANLDKIIGGGFKKNSTNLVVGGTGSGKSIFGVQFLIEGIKKKEKVLYITFEEKKQEFYSNMFALGFDLEALEKKGQFFFIEYTPEKVKTMLEEGGGIIESLVLRKKIQRIVIDSISSFGMLFDDSLEKRKAALSLFNMLRKWDCTSILTSDSIPIKERINTETLGFESDSIILLYFQREKKQRERYLEILKMRGTEHSKKIYSFMIKKGGIILSKKIFSGTL